MVTGLQTNGRRLRDRAYLDELLLAGLDHIQITLESHDAAIHDRMSGAPGPGRRRWRDQDGGSGRGIHDDQHDADH